MADEKKISCGAGQYWKRHNKKGMVYAFAARRTWIPAEYHSGTRKTKKEVETLLKKLESDYKNREFSTAASYFDADETEAAHRLFLKFEDENSDFKEDRPRLDSIVEAGLRSWRFDPFLRAKLKGGSFTVATAYEVFFKERRKVIQETIAEDRKMLKKILFRWWDKSIYELFEPPRMGDDPRDVVKNRLKEGIATMRRGDGLEFSDNTKLKRAKTVKHFFKVVRDYFTISHPNPAEDLVGYFSFKRTGTPKTADMEKVARMFSLLKHDPRFHRLIPYAAFFFFAGRRPSDVQKHRRGIGKVRADYSYFDGFKERSVLGNKKGRRFVLPAEIETERGVSPRKVGYEEGGELCESGFLWFKFYFEKILGEKLPETGEIFYSRDLWDALRRDAGWILSKDPAGKHWWVPDVARHTFNTAACLYWPEQTSYIHELAGHSTETFRKYYKNPKMTAKAAKKFFEDIRPSKL